MKIIHVFNDGSTTDNLEGKIIKVKGNEQLYQKLEQIVLRDQEEKNRRQTV